MTPFRYPTTIQELVAYYKNKASQYARNLSTRRKEQLAWHLAARDDIDGWEEWCAKYPILEEVYCLASDLSWPNSPDANNDWRMLIKLINKLDKQVNGSK